MGRSAKLHKRTSQQKKTTSVALPDVLHPPLKLSTAVPTPHEQKKRAGLKAKAGKRRNNDAGGPLLGGADYVDLMLGGRRKANGEAAKLPRDS
ncbi:hypothetical protein AcV5_003548 [Taiwanofungus camphoratus]|nr:hypothetical protein AcV5_003548 [Antrodia cinnamomea]